MKKTIKYKFIPIEIKEFAEMVVKNNPSENKTNIITAITDTLEDVKMGEKCECGNPIWVAGSAFIGNSCFTCITSETDTSKDYEIKEALKFY